MGTKTTRAVKLDAWIRFIHPIVLHGIRTLHLSLQISHTMRKWEFGLLRQIIKYRRRACKLNDGTIQLEEAGRFNQRVSRQLYTLFKETKASPIHETTLKVGFKKAWRVENTSVPHLSKGAGHIRGIRAKMWWGGVRSYGSNQRTLGVTKHRRRGPVSSWGQPLLCGIGTRLETKNIGKGIKEAGWTPARWPPKRS